MPKIARDIEIRTDIRKVYNILTDGKKTIEWNPIVNEITPLEERKYLLKSTIGNMVINKIEKVEDIFVKWRMEQSELQSMGYILSEKIPTSTIELWVEFEDKKLKKKFKDAADLTLEGLKKYIDYIEAGGNILKYDKQ